MIHLSVVTPIWKRPALTAAYLTHMQRWKAVARTLGIGFTAVIVGSEGKASRSLVEGRPSFWYVEHPNEPLGAKFNAGVQKALSIGADYVLIMGSDQFADPSLLDFYAVRMRGGAVYTAPLDTYVYDPAQDEARYWPGYTDKRRGLPVGPGRLIRRDVLMAFDGELYAPGLNRNLDGSADAHLPAPETFHAKPFRFVSVKTPESITPFRRYEGESVDATLFKDFLREA